jgi:hypothetical protein
MQTMVEAGPSAHTVVIAQWGDWYPSSIYNSGSSHDPLHLGANACRRGAVQNGIDTISMKY